MPQHKAVIGANFGDEGKGLMTDFFVSQFNGKCFVVRFNGGAQAGHTVVTPEGRRHKFSHFGAGSLLGAPTYLSKYFIANPLLFDKEQRELGFLPEVCVDFDCLISTPYDMFINQTLENSRGEKKHGSCGVGIHETIVRSEQEEFQIKAIDFLDFYKWEPKLRKVAEEYYPKRMEELGLPLTSLDYDKFVNVFEEFSDSVDYGDLETLVGHNIVFEGAQGLLLDQNHPYFPYVTHSNTGFQNVGEILKEIDIPVGDVEVTYVTRSYLTRHGRGPFPTETKTLPYNNIVDDTNIFNEFQEDLRFGILDLPNLTNTIENDVLRNNVENFSIAVTCLDQVDNRLVKSCSDANLHLTGPSPIEKFLSALGRRLPFYKIYSSFGKTRVTIWENCVDNIRIAV